MNDLQTHYADSEEVLIGWKENDLCAVKMTKDGRWHRANILSRPEEHTVRIRAIDFGYEVIN